MSKNYALNNRYPLNTKEDVQKASTYFDKFASQLSVDERHEFASNVCDKARSLCTPVTSSLLNKYACRQYGNLVDSQLVLRESCIHEDSKLSGAFRKLASKRSEIKEADIFAKALYELDKQAGLTKYYDRGIADPFLTTTNSIEKKAEYVYTDEGNYITESKLTSIINDKAILIEKYLGKTLIDGLKSEGYSAFEALPKDAKDIIVRIANGEIEY
jgi:hypothetical protein